MQEVKTAVHDQRGARAANKWNNYKIVTQNLNQANYFCVRENAGGRTQRTKHYREEERGWEDRDRNAKNHKDRKDEDKEENGIANRKLAERNVMQDDKAVMGINMSRYSL